LPAQRADEVLGFLWNLEGAPEARRLLDLLTVRSDA